MGTCPNCGAEIRPGDHFCLNCGRALAVSNSVASPAEDEATEFGNPLSVAKSGASSSNSSSQQQDGGYEGATFMAPPNTRTVENPGHFVLGAHKEQQVQHGTSYGLDKVVTTLGRAPENDIVLLDEEKVISRYHATVRYTNSSYLLIDNGSSNGTSVNGQQVDKQSPRTLQDGDHVTIGDYELVYYAPVSVASEATKVGISLSPPLDFETATFGEQLEEQDESRTATWNWEPDNVHNVQSMPPAQFQSLASASSHASKLVTPPAELDRDAPQQGATPIPAYESEIASAIPLSSTSTPSMTGVTVQRFTNLAHPLPDIAALSSAVSLLNDQVVALQEQLAAANEATQSHQVEIAATAHQLRDGMRQIVDQVDSVVDDGNQSREAVRWEQLLLLAQDVIRNPRDIDNARTFADRAVDIDKILHKYAALLNALTECNNQLRNLVGEDR